MTYRISLARRRTLAEWKRARYWSDPEYRLSCINRTRAKAGLPALDAVPAEPLAKRGARGRFVRA